MAQGWKGLRDLVHRAAKDIAAKTENAIRVDLIKRASIDPELQLFLKSHYIQVMSRKDLLIPRHLPDGRMEFHRRIALFKRKHTLATKFKYYLEDFLLWIKLRKNK